jgi:hypothetical protein
MSEDNFPEEMDLVIVDDLYRNYELGFEEGSDTLLVYCNTCEDLVGQLDYPSVTEMEDMDLYERIIKSHRDIK